MAAKSARRLLELDNEMTVTVKNVEQLGPRLVVMSFVLNRVRYDDVYNVKGPNDMKNLLKVAAGKKVRASIVPDDSSDSDGHPTVKKTTVA